jgi:hypothetical protein
MGQAPDVPVFKQGRRESQYEDGIAARSRELFSEGKAVKLAQVKEQLKRSTCAIELPPPSSRKLGARELWAVARDSHLRLGWAYTCDKCERWHVNLAGAYAIASGGVVATCYHVVQPTREVKDGCLVAADEAGEVHPVTEILAANKYSDACVVKVEARNLKPLPLNTNIAPGDAVYCYSDPLDHRGYYSAGIVNRFYQFPGRRKFSAAASESYAPTRINVSTDWAPGSSGSAVVDEFGNAIGHVSTISALSDEEESGDSSAPPQMGPVMIVFHDAVAASDVLRLVRGSK